MRIFIHRGAEEIGGNCIQLEAQGKSILLDLGAPLSGDLEGIAALPNIDGLQDGSNPDLLGIVISHPHADHYGLTKFAHSSLPIFIGFEADKLLRAAMIFGPFGAEFETVHHYNNRIAFEIGPFRITPYLVDHSAFDAYSFLIEADGKSIFYSGDLRGHGWKKSAFDNLLTSGPKNVDVMLLEGTTLGRSNKEPIASEANLVSQLKHSMTSTDGIVLAGFSGQNIDRLVTFYKAALSSGRTFVVDLYIAHLLLSIGRQSLPDPTTSALRVFLPQRMKSKIIRDKAFDIVNPFYSRRIYPDELKANSSNLVMTFRASMACDLEKADCLTGAGLIYSMWPGYLERSSPNLRDWCNDKGLSFEIIHTSGHASYDDLQKLVTAISPKTLVPIHTFSPEAFNSLHNSIANIPNGEWFDL
jgi:ribonuclease J